MAGLVNRHTSHSLPLKASSVFAEVNGFASRLLATLTYYNDCEYDIEGLFVFPQDERTTIVEFDATIEERHVYTEIREKSSIGSLKNAYAIEEREDELFSLSIGRIPPQASIFVQVGLITELLSDPESRGSLFVLPSVFTPRLYNGNENETQQNNLYGSQMLISDLPRKTHEAYSFDLQLEVVAPCLLAGCSSRTHAIQVDADSKATNASRIHITIAEPHTYDRELEVLLHLSHPFDPYVLIEEGKKVLLRSDNTQMISTSTKTHEEMIEMFAQKPAIMLNFTPQLEPFTKASSEFIFLVDRSGSMSGKHIFQVKETLILLLKSLPLNSTFNIVGFGSYYRSLFQESQEYNNESLEKAMNYVNKMRADLGGTNLILPLEFIFDQPSKRGRPRIIFLLTDGGVSNTLEVVDLVRKHSHTCRFFTFGIGPEACPHLVQGIAGPTTGHSWFITDEERILPKVMEALNGALRPAITDIEVNWHVPDGFDVIQSPRKLPFVFDGERMILYGILSRPLEDEKDSPKTTNKRRMDRTMRSFSNNSVKVFWFDDDMEYLPEEQLLLEVEEQERLAMANNDEEFISIPNSSQRVHPLNKEVHEGNMKENVLVSEAIEHRAAPSSWKENDSALDINFGNFFKEALNKPYDYTKQDNLCEPLTIVNGEPTPKILNNSSRLDDTEVLQFNFQRRNFSQPEKSEDKDIGPIVRSCQNTWPSSDDKAENELPSYYNRDSGVGFSIEDTNRSFEEDFPNYDNDIENDTKNATVTVETTSHLETKEESQESKFTVFKNSDFLEKIAVPNKFAAVEIKGFVGDEEIKQVIPFPIGRSGGSSKRPTIHQLLARSLIREFQICDESDEQIMSKIGMITRQSKVYCRHTAFTSVDQYCYDDEILSALQFASKEDAEAENKQKVLVLERKGGFTTGLGRRFLCPEGSDQESIDSENTDNFMGDGEEPTDLYRLDRSPTIDSSDSSPAKSGCTSPLHKSSYAGRQVPPLSKRYVVGEKSNVGKTVAIPSKACAHVSPVLPKLLQDYQPYVNLAKLQSTQGYWELNEEFAHCLELPLNNIEKASPLADRSVCAFISEELEEIMKTFQCEYSTQIWATALGLAWLVRLHGDAQNEWFLLARKANTWLGECAYPRGFTSADLKKLAYQALVLMRNNSSESTLTSDSSLEKTDVAVQTVMTSQRWCNII